MRKILLALLMMLSMAHVSYAQTIRNTNNSVVAKIDTDGTIRNSTNSVVARISSNGDIRDNNNHYLGKIESDGDIRDSKNSYLGKVENDGTVRNWNNSYLGKVDSNGTVRNSNNSVIGYAKGVPIHNVAIYFFFGFFYCTICQECAKWRDGRRKKRISEDDVGLFLYLCTQLNSKRICV